MAAVVLCIHTCVIRRSFQPCRQVNASDSGEDHPFGGAPGPAPGWQEGSGAIGRQLRALAVTGSNGSAYDLSTSFEPERTAYGAMLPPEAATATLCLQPSEGEHLNLYLSPWYLCAVLDVLTHGQLMNAPAVKDSKRV